jgi:hypothetical protein
MSAHYDLNSLQAEAGIQYVTQLSNPVPLRRIATYLMRRASLKTGILPNRFVIRDVEYDSSKVSHVSGAANVYEGQFQQNRVAVKRLHMYDEITKKV